MTPEPISDERLAEIEQVLRQGATFREVLPGALTGAVTGHCQPCTCVRCETLRAAVDAICSPAEVVRLRASLGVAREQRDKLARIVDPIEPSVPCGDGRCYCGGCVL